ncbi:MAG: fibrobacter succinogenes major paralogous domain-containing protein, partial [Alistipes sp.]|nr:fibrobacter succinogenes major paralogous domain-containing protein [Alistipes sp.]
MSATGYRDRTSGALTNVGANGNYWSSSSYCAGNPNAGDLNFTSSNVNPLNNPNRANGLSVRCAQH